ncbi:MAG TPA: type II toxin-antitoxin system RelE/ParE family toxin [Albitalea sp.]
MRSLAFTPQAVDDLRNARRWYDEQRHGLGLEFESAVEAVLYRALNMPQSFPQALPGVRRAAVRRFPYDAYYRFDDHRLVVVLLFHTAQHPDKAMARLQQQH